MPLMFPDLCEENNDIFHTNTILPTISFLPLYLQVLSFKVVVRVRSSWSSIRQSPLNFVWSCISLIIRGIIFSRDIARVSFVRVWQLFRSSLKTSICSSSLFVHELNLLWSRGRLNDLTEIRTWERDVYRQYTLVDIPLASIFALASLLNSILRYCKAFTSFTLLSFASSFIYVLLLYDDGIGGLIGIVVRTTPLPGTTMHSRSLWKYLITLTKFFVLFFCTNKDKSSLVFKNCENLLINKDNIEFFVCRRTNTF